jgi:GTP:adenosylcobinamide-phosphate guanylyltransferase
MKTQIPEFRAVILAGERPAGSPLSEAFEVSASVMVPVAGKPALQRVMEAIVESSQVNGGLICGPTAAAVKQDESLQTLLSHPDFGWLEQASGPAESAIAALEKLAHFPVLLTAGDHALLTGEIIDEFCQQAISISVDQEADITVSTRKAVSNFDLVVGFVPHELVAAAWPESKRTITRFSDGRFCGSNLFAVLNPEGTKALRFWRQAETDRKHPWRIARRFGYGSLFRYLFRRLTLEDALGALSEATGCRIGYVKVEHARAAVDVDSIEDQKLAEKILSQPS